MIREEHTVQDPNVLLTILSRMAHKPEVKFDKLFQKLYNTDLWLMAYESIAPRPGNMTPGVDGGTIDGTGMARIQALIADLKASRYTPQPVRRVYIPKANGKMRPIGIPSFEDKLLQTVMKFILEDDLERCREGVFFETAKESGLGTQRPAQMGHGLFL